MLSALSVLLLMRVPGDSFGAASSTGYDEESSLTSDS